MTMEMFLRTVRLTTMTRTSTNKRKIIYRQRKVLKEFKMSSLYKNNVNIPKVVFILTSGKHKAASTASSSKTRVRARIHLETSDEEEEEGVVKSTANGIQNSLSLYRYGVYTIQRHCSVVLAIWAWYKPAFKHYRIGSFGGMSYRHSIREV